MNFIDICSGIGGFRSGLERNGHSCIAFAEIDKHATQSYKAIYNTDNEVELGDITSMEDSEWEQFKGNCDMIAGGTPCQSFSMAGKRLGFEDTRGTVFFSYVNAIKQVQPKYFLFENVKGLMSHDKGNTIKVILKAFDEVGYDLDFEVFNSKYYGVPQNRERIYIVGVRKDLSDKPYKSVPNGKKKLDLLKAWASNEVSYKQILPTLQTEVTTRLIDVLENEVDEKYYLSEEKTQKLTLDEDLGGKLNHFNYNEMDRVYSTEKVSPTLNTMQGGNRQPKIAVRGFKEIVKVRKYEVNKLELSELLRIGKQDANISNKEISNILNVPITKVEHWFRSDKSFSIPDASIWFELKKLLNITNTDHDDAITTFEEKESGFDTTNRVYDADHLSPTLNTSSEPKIAILGNTSNTGHRSQDIYNIKGISPTITARDYKGAKQIAIPGLTPDKGIRFTDDGFHTHRNDKKKSSVQGTHVTYKEGKTHALTSNHVPMTLQQDTVIGVGHHPFSKKREFKGYGLICPTLIATDYKAPKTALTNSLRIRKLTPLECWRLQGFSDEQFYKAKNSGMSNSQLYKQAGNSVTVNVVDAIVSNLGEEDYDTLINEFMEE